MKIAFSSDLVLGKTLVLLLSACIVTSVMSFESVTHNFQREVFRRSLPGSLAQAPEGAVGYPPGYGPLPTENGEIPKGTPLASPTQSTDNQAMGKPTDTEDYTSNATDDPRTHIAPVSEMNSFIQKAHTASASKSVVQPLASLLASIAISLLHL